MGSRWYKERGVDARVEAHVIPPPGRRAELEQGGQRGAANRSFGETHQWLRGKLAVEKGDVET
jgi:hypothetical protein